MSDLGRPFMAMEHLESNWKKDMVTVGLLQGAREEFGEGLPARVWARFRETNELWGGPKGWKSVEPLAGGGLNYKRRKQYFSQIVLLAGVGLRVLPIELISLSQNRAEQSREANPEVSIGPVGIE